MTKSGEVQGPGGPDRPAKGQGTRKARGGQGAPAARVRRVAPVSPAAPPPAVSPLAFSPMALRGMPDAEALAIMKAAADQVEAREALEMDAKVARIKRQLADGTYVIDEDKLVEAFLRRMREWPDG